MVICRVKENLQVPIYHLLSQYNACVLLDEAGVDAVMSSIFAGVDDGLITLHTAHKKLVAKDKAVPNVDLRLNVQIPPVNLFALEVLMHSKYVQQGDSAIHKHRYQLLDFIYDYVVSEEDDYEANFKGLGVRHLEPSHQLLLGVIAYRGAFGLMLNPDCKFLNSDKVKNFDVLSEEDSDLWSTKGSILDKC